jgi:hypothetical protein
VTDDDKDMYGKPDYRDIEMEWEETSSISGCRQSDLSQRKQHRYDHDW